MRRVCYFVLVMVSFVACSSNDFEKFEHAIKTDNIKLVEKYIEKGISLSGEMYTKQPLLVAAENANTEIFRILLSSGADYRYDSFSILSYLIDSASKELITILLENSSINSAMRIRSKGFSVFYWASMQTDSDFICRINDGKQDWTERYNDIPLLNNLIDNYSAETMYELIPDELSINDPDANGVSPLGYALVKGKISTAKILFHKGFRLEKISRNPWMTIGTYWIPEFELLFSSSHDALVDIKLADSGLLSGVVFNQYLSYEERIKLFRKFLQLGVDSKAKDPEGMTPLDYLYDIGYGPSIGETDENDDKEKLNRRKYADEIIAILNSN